MAAYYNEFDPYAAEWLRNLIKAGHIAPGDVDERSIEDVSPDDLKGYTQCHFFAGIGIWSYALRRAGWPDDREVWTGSCPCQPFSAAGKGAGFADERHLWPAFFHLIGERSPAVVFGEQVASKDGLGWLDLVQADLEGARYASGAVDLCAAGVGAPHIRQRLWWVAERLGGVALGDPFRSGLEGQRRGFETAGGYRPGSVRPAAEAGELGGLADAESGGRREEQSNARRSFAGDGARQAVLHSGSSGIGGLADDQLQQRQGSATSCDVSGGREQEPAALAGLCGGSGLANSESGSIPDQSQRTEPDFEGRAPELICTDNGSDCGASRWNDTEGGLTGGAFSAGSPGPELGLERPGPTNGYWRDADWLFCRDGKWRPVEPGTFPLAHGAPARVGRLRAYGNAIVAEAAQAFIESYLDTRTISS